MGLFRLFLALIVATDHWRAIVLRPRGLDNINGAYEFGFNAGYAVMFFYVISGFLITYTLLRNYSSDIGGLAKFYRNRFVRIFSLYWPCVLFAFFFIGGAWPAFLAAGSADKLTGIFILGQDWRVAFAGHPSTHFEATIPGLHQSWTLGAELTFYLFAPFLLRSWRLVAALVALSFCARAAFIRQFGDIGSHPVWTYHFFVSTAGFFLLGQLACAAGERLPWLKSPRLGVVLMAACLGVMEFGSYKGFDSRRFWLSVLLFSMGLPGLFAATKNSRVLNFLGELSFPTYLIHGFVLVLAGDAILNTAVRYGSPVSVFVFLSVVLVCAIATRYLVELPAAIALRAFIGLRKLIGDNSGGAVEEPSVLPSGFAKGAVAERKGAFSL